MTKRLFMLFAVIAISIAANTVKAQISRGQKTMGVKAGYITFNHSASAGIEFEYAFSPHFVLAPNIDFVFRNDGVDGVLFNIDYHGPWALDSRNRWFFYHILGVNYVSWSTHPQHAGDESKMPDNGYDDVTTRFNRVGLDFGAGIECFITSTLRLSLQGKFNWVKEHDSGIFNIGISYVF